MAKEVVTDEIKKIKCIARKPFILNGIAINPNDSVEMLEEEFVGAVHNKLVYKTEDK